jgi:Family of unknown function (DUF6600)/FecR protein
MSSRAFMRFALAVLFGLLISFPAFADSHVRIVRLSYIEGGVQVDRNTGHYENAIVNLPITEGMKLRTASDGRAEVEFEDGSTLRLAPDTTVEFPQLALRDSGGKLSSMDLISGTVYLDFGVAQNDTISAQFGGETLALKHTAHLRITDDGKGATVAVFKGEVQVDGPSGAVEVKKNQTANFGSASDGNATVARNIEPEPLDSWDKQQSQYHQRYTASSYNSCSPYAYGTSDLAYYGHFFDAPGYGLLWQPYLVGMGWNPFMDGAWAFSTGFGYSWVSGYPWGWTPYHYGAWVFLPGYGWAWQPGGVWTPWYSRPRLLNSPAGFKPPQPPTTFANKGVSIVTVNHAPAFNRGVIPGSKVMIRSNSAGLGVPRGQVANLARVSREVQQRGAVMQPVHAGMVAPPPSFPRMDAASGMESSPRRQTRTSAPRPSIRAPAPGPPSAPRTSGPHRK